MRGYTIQRSIELLENEVKSDSGNASINDYSLNETIIGKWIDNTPIYRKVLEIPITQKNTDYDISALNVGLMLNLYGAVGATHLPYNTTHEAGVLTYSIGLNYGSDTIQIRFGADQEIATPCYVVCEYTKKATTTTKRTSKKK